VRQVARTEHIILTPASWETYRGLVADRGSVPHPLLAFDGTTVELISPGKRHELYTRIIEGFLNGVMSEWQVNMLAVGSMTLSLKPAGAEPDNSFYIAHAATVAGGADRDIDLSVDAPPDLAIKIDISRERSDKLAIYRQLGVPEFWRLRPPVLEGFALVGGEYVPLASSRVIRGLPLEALMSFIERACELDRITVLSDWTAWLRETRDLHFSL
jgi:Uma2 family endonuclease